MSLLAASWIAWASPSWQAPAECPDQADFHARIVSLAGRLPNDDEIVARARVEGGPPWSAEIDLEIDGARERRHLSSADCDALSDAVALLVAVTVDPLVVAKTIRDAELLPPHASVPAIPDGTGDPVAGPEPVSPRDAMPVAAPTPAPKPARPRPWASFRAGAGGELGAVPRGTGGFELGVSVVWPHARIDWIGRYWIRRRDVLSPGAGADIELGTAGMRGCGQIAQRRLFVPLCAGLEAGALAARGFGVVAARPASIPWLAATGSGSIGGWVTARVALWAGVELAIPLLQPRVTLATDPETQIHRVAPVSGRVVGGIEIRLSSPRDGSSASRR